MRAGNGNEDVEIYQDLVKEAAPCIINTITKKPGRMSSQK